MTEKQKGGATLIFALVIALAWFFLRFHQSAESVDHLTPVGSIQGWYLKNRSANYGSDAMSNSDPYVWLTDQELLHFRKDAAQGFRAVVFDTGAHRDQPAPGLLSVQPNQIMQASPDGKWLLWGYSRRSSPLSFDLETVATRCADGKICHWPDASKSSFEGCWMPDSRRWVCFDSSPTGTKIHGKLEGTTGLAVFSVDHPGCRFYPLSRRTTSTSIFGVTNTAVILSQFKPLSAPMNPAEAAHPSLWLTEVSLTTPHVSEWVFPVTLPPAQPGGVSEILLSPSGQTILWTCLSSRSSLIAWNSSEPSVKSLDVWICRMKGGPPHHLGTWSATRIGKAHWNPDGRHISFSLEDVLYSLPVSSPF